MLLEKKAAKRIGLANLEVVRDDPPTERIRRQPHAKPAKKPWPGWLVFTLVALVGAAGGIGLVFAAWRLS